MKSWQLTDPVQLLFTSHVIIPISLQTKNLSLSQIYSITLIFTHLAHCTLIDRESQ